MTPDDPYIYRHTHALQAARFVERPHRFCVAATLVATGERVECHMADPGRLSDLLKPGAVLHVSGPFGGKRKLPYSAVLVESRGVCVSLVTPLANRLFEAALTAGLLPALVLPERLEHLEREVKVGHSRLDFRLHTDEGPCLVEVKSVTMMGAGGVGRFPDAPSARACRHLDTLRQAAERGTRAAAVFVGGRSDLVGVGAAAHIDPEFAEALLAASTAGVELHALCATLDTVGVSAVRVVPVLL